MSKLRTLASFNWLALVLAVALLAVVIFGYCKWRQASYHLVPFPKADFLALDLARGGLDPTKVFNDDGSLKLDELPSPPAAPSNIQQVKAFYGGNFNAHVDDNGLLVYANIDIVGYGSEEDAFDELHPQATLPTAGLGIEMSELQRSQVLAIYGPPSVKEPWGYRYCFDLPNGRLLDFWFPFGRVEEWEYAQEDDPVHGLSLLVHDRGMADRTRSMVRKRHGRVYQWPCTAESADEQ